MQMRPQDKMMQARPQPVPQSQDAPAEESASNPLEILDGISPQMIDSMTEQDAKGILSHIVSTLNPDEQAEAPTM